MNKTRALLFAVLIFCFPSPALKAQDIPLSLEDAVSLALRENRDIRLKAEELRKAKAGINEARSGLFPGVSAGAGWSDIRGLYSKDVSGFSGQAGVSQVIYSGGRVINAIKAREQNYIATQAVLDAAKLEIISRVKKAYYALILAEEFAALNKNIVDNTREHLDLARARFSGGQASESDLIKIKASLAQVVQVYEASLSQIDSCKAVLSNLLFLDKDARIKAEGKLDYEPKEIAFDRAFLQALQSRPEIRQAEARKNAASKNIEIARAGNRPQVSAAWDYYSSQHPAAGTARNQNDYNVLGLSVNWPVFDGWLTKSRVEQAVIDLKEAELLKDKTLKDIALELKTAYLELKDAIERMKTADEEINVYRDGLAVIREKQKTGLASGLDLADAQLSYQVALFNRVQASYDCLTAKIRFDKSTGGM